MVNKFFQGSVEFKDIVSIIVCTFSATHQRKKNRRAYDDIDLELGWGSTEKAIECLEELSTFGAIPNEV